MLFLPHTEVQIHREWLSIFSQILYLCRMSQSKSCGQKEYCYINLWNIQGSQGAPRCFSPLHIRNISSLIFFWSYKGQELCLNIEQAKRQWRDKHWAIKDGSIIQAQLQLLIICSNLFFKQIWSLCLRFFNYPCFNFSRTLHGYSSHSVLAFTQLRLLPLWMEFPSQQ